MDFDAQAVKIFRALADATRYHIIVLLLEKGELGCTDFDRAFQHSKSAMSHHYRILENADLIQTQKVGQHVRIRARKDTLKKFLPGFEKAHVKIAKK